MSSYKIKHMNAHYEDEVISRLTIIMRKYVSNSIQIQIQIYFIASYCINSHKV